MASSSFTLDPSLLQPATTATAVPPNRVSWLANPEQSLHDFRNELQRQSLLVHENTANDALNQYRQAALQSICDYGNLRGSEAVDGHDSYSQALRDSRDQALGRVSGPARALLQPHLDQHHEQHLRMVKTHHGKQADRVSLDSLVDDLAGAQHWHDNPDELQRIADRGEQEWLQIAQRKGWSQQQLDQQVEEWKAQVYDLANSTRLNSEQASNASPSSISSTIADAGSLSPPVDALEGSFEPSSVSDEYNVAALGGFDFSPRPKPLLPLSNAVQIDGSQSHEADDEPRIVLAQKGPGGGGGSGRRGGYQKNHFVTQSVPYGNNYLTET